MTYNPSFYDSFDPALFESGVQDGCGVVYAWVWNTEISRELIDKQIDEMYGAGVRCFYVLPEPAHFRPAFMSTRLCPEYLSEDFFALIRYTAEMARELGMTMWLYDEGGWPSGSGCGEVTKERPDLLTLCLHKEEVTLEAGATFIGDENTVSAFSCGKRAPLPFTSEAGTTLSVYSRIHPDNRFPYLLNKEAIKAFIDCTYERYRECLGDLFGTTVQAIFTDEAILHYPFCLIGDDLKGFEEKYGYDFAQMIPAVFEGTDKVSATFRADYIDYCGTLFAGRYLKALQEWCRDAGILFTGHMNGDHDLYAFDMSAGNLLTHLRMMDIPGIDAISRQIHEKTPAASFPRFASSAAAQTGAKGVLSESFGVYGALPFREMRYVCGHQLVRGVNILNFMVIPAGRDGYLGSQERPAFLPEDPDRALLAPFNRYISRLQYLCRIGKRSADCAVYAPMRDIWAFKPAQESFDTICRSLEERQISFDIIDDDFLENCALRDGKLSMGDAEYSRIYLPGSDYMRKGAKDALSRFTEVGGEVILGEETCENEHSNIRKLVRKWDSGELYLYFNEDNEKCTYPHGLGDGLYLADAVSGRIYRAPDTLTLSGGEVCALIRTDEPLPAENTPEEGKLIGEYLPGSAAVISKTTFENGKLVKTEENTPMEGRCAHLSGAIRYTFGFECEAGADIIIDLREVHDCATISLNEKEIGYTLFPPHSVKAEGKFVKERNTLTVTVYNSSAAAYSSADLSAAPRETIGPYHAVSAEYEKECTLCGLKSSIRVHGA